ncbi:hypothetical protein Tco_1552742, partial [Tanacetum coccineum]
QYLDLSHNRLLSNIRGGCSKLLAAFSVARISLGLLDRMESSPWLGPQYGENLSLPFCPRWSGGPGAFAFSLLDVENRQICLCELLLLTEVKVPPVEGLPIWAWKGKLGVFPLTRPSDD